MTTPAPQGDPIARRRLVVFAVVAAAAVASAAVYVAVRAIQARSGEPDGGGVAAVAAVGSAPVVLFRNIEPTPQASFGKVGRAPLGPSPGVRSLTTLSCARLHYAAGQGLCVEGAESLTEPASLRTFGSDLVPRWTHTLSGLPSRARVSPHGRYGAVTVFVTGHGYEDLDMSTQTLIIDLRADAVVADLESFEVRQGGQTLRSPDFNFWGVTFANDDDRFYATLASGKKTWLIEGRVSDKRAEALRENAECPSLSPDQKRLVYKKRTGKPGEWRLHVLDIASNEERALAEERSIDDQVEWLDDERILYKHGPTVFSVDVGGSTPPSVYLDRAASPAVVRAP